MDAYNPFEDPTEETDVLTGQRVMPNVPRDPNDPREKLRSYLAQKMESEKKMMTPEYRQAMRAPQNELMDSNRGLALQGLLQNSAAMLGTVGGKTASTAGSDNYLKQLQGFNADTMRGIEGERSQMQGMEDQRLKMMQYLADRQGTAEEKAAMMADRERSRQMQQKSLDLQTANAQRSAANQERMGRLAEERLAMDRASAQKASPEAKLNAQFAKSNTEFNQYMDNSLNKVAAIAKQIRNEGTWDAVGPEAGNLKRDIYDLAINYAKIVDPESVAREGEVAAAQKYMLDVQGFFKRNATAEQAVENMKKSLQDRVRARERSTPGYKPTPYIEEMIAQPLYQEEGTAQAAPPPPPAPAAAGGMDYDSMSDEELQSLFNQRVGGGGRP
jgi:hypothetical protein